MEEKGEVAEEGVFCSRSSIVAQMKRINIRHVNGQDVQSWLETCKKLTEYRKCNQDSAERVCNSSVNGETAAFDIHLGISKRLFALCNKGYEKGSRYQRLQDAA
ncbi:Hypothetical predicted protein [Octopus vulgaris]|uniref:Uncharacterized protein n=1 Tax=Octopus vulgaris TaxID=6645 RepID=A0AA36BID8_OCTVU|nr:Hypothetical predicted protein [Octopus vulgaris]